MNFKMSEIDSELMPWEFRANMRPWIQPYFYLILSKFLNLFGVNNPVNWLIFFRLSSALIGFTATICLLTQVREFIKDELYQKITIFSSLFLWFFPYIHGRISSEALGASIFSIAFCLFFNGIKNKSHFLLAGALIALSVQVRYHIGFMVVPLLLWAFILKKVSHKDLFKVITSALFITIACTYIDSLGYSKFIFTPLNYFSQNIVENKAVNYGTSPFYQYLKDVFNKAIAPFGIIIILSFIHLWIKKPKHVLTWITLPFFIIHSITSHKEWRFLFPLTPFVPIVLGIYLESIKSFLNKYSNKFKIVIKILIIINFSALIISIFKPAHHSESFYRYTFNMNPPMKKLYVYGSQLPFWGGPLSVNIFNFHKPEIVTLKNISLEEVTDSSFLVFTSKGIDYFKLKSSENCNVKFHSGIDVITRKRSKTWSLFECKK
jgi:phosphatidylinositol glycan class B